jgi:membrane protein
MCCPRQCGFDVPACRLNPTMNTAHPDQHSDPTGTARATASSGGLAFARRLKARIADDNLPVIAAGVAFYGLLALFPALTALVAIYGLVLDPQQITQQMAAMQAVLPAQVVQLVTQQLQDLTATQRSSLSLGAAGALLLALWSASAAIRTLIKALNVAYGVEEERSVVKRAGVAMLLTLGAIAGGIVAITAVVLLPTVVNLLGLDPMLRGVLTYARWPILAALVWLGVLVVYRFGPNRRHARWSWSNRGAAAAIGLWLVGSVLFSWYVENLANFNRTYGSMGAIVVLLFWFLLSGYAVLFGAELNAELEQASQRGNAARADRLQQGRATRR